jgi:tetratricopeptide (TPR) repeat protein
MLETQTSTIDQKNDQLFELGKLHMDRCDFTQALTPLKQAAQGYLESRNFSMYLETQSKIMRISAERDQLQDIQEMKEKLQDLILKEGFELSAKTYYTLALCAVYKNDPDTAFEYLQKGLSIALAVDNKKDICYCIYGMAVVYRVQGRVEEALKEVYNLQVFFQVIDSPEIKIASQMLNAEVLIDLKKFDQAIEILWQSYDLVRKEKNLFMHIRLLINMGRAYLRAGNKEMAKVYLGLADKVCDPEQLEVQSRIIKDFIAEVGEELNQNYDLIFDLENHAVTEKKLGRVDFKNQFILLDLLKLFVQNQGQVYSKEFLVEHVWKQTYDPSVHDNKIYVTIKRLRKLIEPDYEKPKYIFRAKNGYYMNKVAKIYFEQSAGGIQ